MEDAIKLVKRLEINLPSPQQLAMRYLNSFGRANHRDMLADLKIYHVDLCAICDLATNRSNYSAGVRNAVQLLE